MNLNINDVKPCNFCGGIFLEQFLFDITLVYVVDPTTESDTYQSVCKRCKEEASVIKHIITNFTDTSVLKIGLASDKEMTWIYQKDEFNDERYPV